MNLHGAAQAAVERARSADIKQIAVEALAWVRCGCAWRLAAERNAAEFAGALPTLQRRFAPDRGGGAP